MAPIFGNIEYDIKKDGLVGVVVLYPTCGQDVSVSREKKSSWCPARDALRGSLLSVKRWLSPVSIHQSRLFFSFYYSL